MRIYVVKDRNQEDSPGMLVRAHNKGAALRFVAERTMDAVVATQDDLVRLVSAGAKVEEVGQEAVQEQEQGEEGRKGKGKAWPR